MTYRLKTPHLPATHLLRGPVGVLAPRHFGGSQNQAEDEAKDQGDEHAQAETEEANTLQGEMEKWSRN